MEKKKRGVTERVGATLSVVLIWSRVQSVWPVFLMGLLKVIKHRANMNFCWDVGRREVENAD